jgi:hypothetical protein
VTAKAAKILEEVKRLSPAEQRELIDSILRETSAAPATAVSPRKHIGDVAGKYRPLPANGEKDHDQGFAEAILQSKNPPRSP